MNDPIKENLNYDFMDSFHDYGFPHSLWRYQHRCRMEIIDNLSQKYSNSNSNVLDAGAGKGPVSFFLIDKVKKVITVEFDKKNAERIEGNFKNKNKESKLNLIQADLRDLSEIKDSFDLIICSEVLEHIDDYQTALRELIRLLKENGKIVLSMPNVISSFWLYDMFIYYVVKIVRKIKGRKPQGGYSFWERSRHWSFSSKKIRNIMTQNNLKIIEEEATSFLFFSDWIYKLFCFDRNFLGSHKLEKYLSSKLPRLSGTYFLVVEKI